MKKTEEKFTAKETQKRFEAALRGARVSGHKPMNQVSPKKAKASRKRKAK